MNEKKILKFARKSIFNTVMRLGVHIPEHIRSLFCRNCLREHLFRNISVHFTMVLRYSGKNIPA